MSPDVADFGEQCDGILVHIQRLEMGTKGQSVRVTWRTKGRGGAGRTPNTDIVAALVR